MHIMAGWLIALAPTRRGEGGCEGLDPGDRGVAMAKIGPGRLLPEGVATTIRIIIVLSDTTLQKKLAINVDDRVYVGLHTVIGRRRISRFIESPVRFSRHRQESEFRSRADGPGGSTGSRGASSSWAYKSPPLVPCP